MAVRENRHIILHHIDWFAQTSRHYTARIIIVHDPIEYEDLQKSDTAGNMYRKKICAYEGIVK